MCGFVVTTDIDNIQNMTERQAFEALTGVDMLEIRILLWVTPCLI